MGPCAFIGSPRQPLFKFLLNHYKALKRAVAILRIYKITFDNRIGIKIGEMACRTPKASTTLRCKLLMSLLDSSQINCVINLFIYLLLLYDFDSFTIIFFKNKNILDKFTQHFYQYAGWNLNSSASSLWPIDSIRLVLLQNSL